MSGFGAGCRGGQDRGQAGSSRHDSKLIQSMQHGMTVGACDVRDAGWFISASIIQLAVDCSSNVGIGRHGTRSISHAAGTSCATDQLVHFCIYNTTGSCC